MNLETIIWWIAFFVIWEVIYLLTMKFGGCRLRDWFQIKISTGIIILLLIAIHGAIVFYNTDGSGAVHYSRLLWEFGIITSLSLFFGLNKLLAYWIRK